MMRWKNTGTPIGMCVTFTWFPRTKMSTTDPWIFARSPWWTVWINTMNCCHPCIRLLFIAPQNSIESSRVSWTIDNTAYIVTLWFNVGHDEKNEIRFFPRHVSRTFCLLQTAIGVSSIKTTGLFWKMPNFSFSGIIEYVWKHCYNLAILMLKKRSFLGFQILFGFETNARLIFRHIAFTYYHIIR